MLARLSGLHGVGREIAPALGERRQHLYRLRHIALAATVIFLATTRFRLLTAQVQLGQGFTQGEDLLHQRPEAREIEIVELIKLLHPGVAAVNQIAQTFFQRLQFQLAGGHLRIAPLGYGALTLQPGGNGRHRRGVVLLLKRHDDCL